MNIGKEDQLFLNRLRELTAFTDRKGIPFYTGFLGLHEQSLFHSAEHEIRPPVRFRLFGGYGQAERQMVCFYNEDTGIEPDFPIHTVLVSTLDAKFGEKLTHRDYLGAILNLGLDRSGIGDILVMEKCGYIFCTAKLSAFLEENLLRIRHTCVSCHTVEFTEADYTPETEIITVTVASARLDAVLAAVYHGARTLLASYISSGKVFVNGKQIDSNSFQLKTDDVVSVRGLGKFIYRGVTGQTRKGRLGIEIQKYVG
ncbi:RNA-binding protein [Anaerolentibacter hominis]|uniref:YlmH family RNA-binding protein n=1 Tax=Anaerolentibacter hominis TaxID=3079009 RepID=UPI0031B8AF8D